MKRVGIIGSSGLVGTELVLLLENDPCVPKPLHFFGRSDHFEFEGLTHLFIATPSDVARKIAPLAIAQGVKVIDLSSAHRMSQDSCLFHPGFSFEMARQQLFSIPNCIVAIMMSVLAPLHKQFQIERIFVATYQAASGAGKEGLEELLFQKPPSVFPHPLHQNLFLHESAQGEEEKIVQETKRFLGQDVRIHARTVRVPVLRAHSMTLNVTFKNKVDTTELLAILAKEKSLRYSPSPTPKIAEGVQEVFYGPIRQDFTLKNSFDLWVCGDQLLRGAALTALECLKAGI